jgi:hypothetical protein
MNTNTATEYRNLPLSVLTESKTRGRRSRSLDSMGLQGCASLYNGLYRAGVAQW